MASGVLSIHPAPAVVIQEALLELNCGFQPLTLHAPRISGARWASSG
jgi:hypothetical protein